MIIQSDSKIIVEYRKWQEITYLLAPWKEGIEYEIISV